MPVLHVALYPHVTAHIKGDEELEDTLTNRLMLFHAANYGFVPPAVTASFAKDKFYFGAYDLGDFPVLIMQRLDGDVSPAIVVLGEQDLREHFGNDPKATAVFDAIFAEIRIKAGLTAVISAFAEAAPPTIQ